MTTNYEQLYREAVAVLRGVEWLGTEFAYADNTAPACPACNAVKPEERAVWWEAYIADDVKVGSYKARSHERPDGPVHADDCKLAAVLRGEEGP